MALRKNTVCFCMYGANVSKTEIGMLKTSEKLTRFWEPKDKNVLLQSKRL